MAEHIEKKYTLTAGAISPPMGEEEYISYLRDVEMFCVPEPMGGEEILAALGKEKKYFRAWVPHAGSQALALSRYFAEAGLFHFAACPHRVGGCCGCGHEDLMDCSRSLSCDTAWRLAVRQVAMVPVFCVKCGAEDGEVEQDEVEFLLDEGVARYDGGRLLLGLCDECRRRAFEEARKRVRR